MKWFIINIKTRQYLTTDGFKRVKNALGNIKRFTFAEIKKELKKYGKHITYTNGVLP